MTTSTHDRVLDRVRKLLKLAGNAGSEAEAALAAERAAKLMAQHEIHEAQIALDSPNEPRTPEPIEKQFEVTKTSKRVAWHMKIGGAVAKSYGAVAYWHGGQVVLFGRLSAVQAASYTTQYLIREVERIVDHDAPTPAHTRRFRNAFRLGCASRLRARLDEQTAINRKRAGFTDYDRSDLPDDDPDYDPVPADDGEALPPPPASAGVLVRVQKDRQEVHDEYKEFSRKWTRGHAIGQVSSGSGYSAGRKAGDRVSLGGGGRGALPKGQEVLK